MKPNYNNIGVKIRKLREITKMLQNKLALKLEISQTTLHRIESSKTKKVDFFILNRICVAFDKNISFFEDD